MREGRALPKWSRLLQGYRVQVAVAIAIMFCCTIVSVPIGGGSRSMEHQPLVVALVADTHCTRGTDEDKPMYRGRFEKAIGAVNDAQVDVVLIAGDLTSGMRSEQIHDFQQLVREFEAPAFFVPGNHDVGDK